MTDEEKTPDVDRPETPVEEAPTPEIEAECAAAEEAPKVDHAPREERHGRLIAAGIVAAVIVSAVAIAVAGIFQLTSKWLFACPWDMTVNGPAPVLWNEVASDKVTQHPLGVPEQLARITKFKTQEP